MTQTTRFTARTKILVALLLLAVAGGWFARAKMTNMVARRFLAERDVEHARKWLNITQRLSPRDAEAPFLLARASRREGKLTEAAEHLERSKQLGWERELVERERWLMLAQSGEISRVGIYLPDLLTDPRGDGAEICEAFVIGYIKLNDLDSAKQLLSVWKSDFPHDAQPHFWEGMIQQNYNQWSKAIESHRRALSIDPSHEQSLFALAECLSANKRPDEAIQYYLSAEQISDDKPRAWTGQAHCLRELGRADEALVLLERALKEEPDHPDALLEWAQLKLERGEFAEALEPLSELAASQPRNWDIQFAHAVAMRGTGDLEGAKVLFDKVSHARDQIRKANNLADQMERSDTSARYEVGVLHLNYGHPSEGLWWLNSVLNFDPYHAQTHQALATYYSEMASDDPQFAVLAERHRRLAESHVPQPKVPAQDGH